MEPKVGDKVRIWIVERMRIIFSNSYEKALKRLSDDYGICNKTLLSEIAIIHSTYNSDISGKLFFLSFIESTKFNHKHGFNFGFIAKNNYTEKQLLERNLHPEGRYLVCGINDFSLLKTKCEKCK